MELGWEHEVKLVTPDYWMIMKARDLALGCGPLYRLAEVKEMPFWLDHILRNSLSLWLSSLFF